MHATDHSGKRFGKLTALTRCRVATNSGKLLSAWRCQCDCGNTTVVRTGDLISGNTTSCGCWGRSRIAASTKTHGLRRTPEYSTWAAMIQRCTNPNLPSFHNWGGRGIQICPQWRHDFMTFYRDMGRKPTLTHTLERIDTDGHYEPDNCRWATRREQSRNQRSNHPLTFQGRTQLMTDWAQELHIKLPTLCQRLRRGMSVEQALSYRIQRH